MARDTRVNFIIANHGAAQRHPIHPPLFYRKVYLPPSIFFHEQNLHLVKSDVVATTSKKAGRSLRLSVHGAHTRARSGTRTRVTLLQSHEDRPVDAPATLGHLYSRTDRSRG